MVPTLASWLDFLSEYAMLIAGISMASFITGLILAPFFIARIPADYFSHPHRHRISASARHPLMRLLLAGIKNLFGVMLVVAGLVMLFIPGQGLLTLLAGLTIMNYPGKFALERWFVSLPHILTGMNWLRSRSGHPPLLPPRDSD